MRHPNLWGWLLATLCSLAATRSYAEPVQLTILHVNDTHSWLDAYGDKRCGQAGDTGGIARAASVVKAVRAGSPNVIALHAGDLMHGTELFNGYFGAPELSLLDELGFAAMTVGNHEFDFGPDFLSMVLNQSQPSFPLLGANLDLTNYPVLKRWIAPSVVREVGGLKVALFGMTTPDDPAYQPAPVRILGAGDPQTLTTIARNTAIALRQQGADLVILLSHLGAEYDRLLGQSVPEIGVIVGGHTHSPTKAPELFSHAQGGSTIYVRAGANYSAVGKLVVSVDAGVVTLVGFERVLLDASVKPDPETQATVETLKQGLTARYGDLYRDVIGYAPMRIEGSVASESARRDTPLGNLLTDAYRARTGTDLAFTPSGLFGGPLFAGCVTPADLMRVTSYGHDPASGYGLKMATFKISGAELIKGLEVGLAIGGDLFLEVSGLSFRYDSSAPDFAKIDVRSVRVGAKKLRTETLYTATINEGSARLLGLIGVNVQDLTPLPDLEFMVLRDYVARLPLVWSTSWGRIWDVARESAAR